MDEGRSRKAWIFEVIRVLFLDLPRHISMCSSSLSSLVFWLGVEFVVLRVFSKVMILAGDQLGNSSNRVVHILRIMVREESGTDQGLTHIRDGFVAKFVGIGGLGSLAFLQDKPFRIPGSSVEALRAD